MGTIEKQPASDVTRHDTASIPSCNTWRRGVLAACALALITLYPTFLLWYDRGQNYNGFYGLQQYDEEFYAGYIQALALGRPRKSDPAQCGGSSTHESLFSIQSLPAYLIATPARFLGISVSRAFIILTPLIAFFSALSVFLLLRELTHDSSVSAVGALMVLCLGTMLTGEGLTGGLKGSLSFHGLMFLRRYLPALPFPLLFGYFAVTLRAFTGKAEIKYSLASALLLVGLMFSYFYLWTFGAAWCVFFIFILLLGNVEFRAGIIYRILPTAVLVPVALLVYFSLLSQRAVTSDPVIALELSHAPDFSRYSEVACLVIAVVLYLLLRRKPSALTNSCTLFTFSLLLTPFVVFNQQILTGRSLQPYHYEFYVCNYVTMLAAILAAWTLWKHRIRKAPILVVGCLSLFWGWGEIAISAAYNRAHNVQRDALMSVSDRITSDGLIYSKDIWIVSNHISTFSSSPVLWGVHTPICVGFTPEEVKKRFFMYLYYSGYGSESLRSALQDRNYVLSSALFGYERAGAKLQESKRPIGDDEIEQAVENYKNFIANFTFDVARSPELSYVITTGSEAYPANVDRWYQRDHGERIGDFVLYRVTLRQP